MTPNIDTAAINIRPHVSKDNQSVWDFIKGSLGTVHREFGMIG